MENASRVSNKTEEADGESTEMTFGTFENDVEALEAVKNGGEALDEFSFGVGEDNDIINKDITDDTNEASEDDFGHATLKPGRSVGKTKRYAIETVLAEWGDKG